MAKQLQKLEIPEASKVYSSHKYNLVTVTPVKSDWELLELSVISPKDLKDVSVLLRNSPDGTYSTEPPSKSGARNESPVGRAADTPKRSASRKNDHIPPPIGGRDKKVADGLVGQFVRVESRVKTNLARPPEECLQSWDEIIRLRNKLQSVFESIVQKDIYLLRDVNIDMRMWKIGYHSNITLLRQLLNKTDGDLRMVVKKKLINTIDQGYNFYKGIVKELEVCYGVAPVTHFQQKPQPVGISSSAKHEASNALYSSLIYIGDLLRYQDEDLKKGKMSKIHYEMARQLYPSRGRAYSQMAVVAFNREDLLSRVYYYSRSISCKYPVPISRSHLLDIFDMIYKMHEKDAKSYWRYRSKYMDFRYHKRKDIWIHPCYAKSTSEPILSLVAQTKEEHIRDLKPDDVFYKFFVSYTKLNGIFFTKIGVDGLEAAAEETLVYFEACLQKSYRFQFHRLMQVAALNMFILHSVKTDGHLKAMEHMVYLETVAVQFFLEMLSLVVEELTNICDLLLWDSSRMQAYAAFIMICCQWLAMHPKLFFKPRSRPSFAIRRIECKAKENDKNLEDDVWIVYSNLMNRLSPLLTRHQEFLFPSVTKEADEEHIRLLTPLPECITMAGFTCFEQAEVLKKQYFATEYRSLNRGQNYIRLKFIYEFGNELVRSLILESSKDKCGLTVYSNATYFLPTLKESDKCGLTTDHYQYWNKNWNTPKRSVALGKSANKRSDCNNSRIILKPRDKKPVCNSPPLKTNPLPKMETYEVFTILKRNRMQIAVVVRPRRILIDTNCFILHLEYVQFLLKFFTGPILVPFSVILELKGLQKGGFTKRDRLLYKNESDPGASEKLMQNMYVAETCKKALQLIENHLGSRFLLISCFGRKMTEIISIYGMIHDDYFDQKRTNDERILDAGYFLEYKDIRLRKKDHPHRIYRDTIILTSDRMMRVHAFDNDIPCPHILTFCYWVWRTALENDKAKPREIALWSSRTCAAKFPPQ